MNQRKRARALLMVFAFVWMLIWGIGMFWVGPERAWPAMIVLNVYVAASLIVSALTYDDEGGE